MNDKSTIPISKPHQHFLISEYIIEEYAIFLSNHSKKYFKSQFDCKLKKTL